jgi:uncharacterized membrane protein
MNLVLWAAQGFLAVVFLAAGIMKLTQAKAVLETRPGMGYVTERTALEMKLIGLVEVLGSLGLILPWWRQTLPMLTPTAAAGLTVLMIGATATHLRRKESMVFTAGLALAALFVALGRGGLLN